MKQVDPKEMTVEALKALGYDLVNELTRIQANLQVINAELSKRQEVKPEEGEVIK